jgi:transposase-like protein
MLKKKSNGTNQKLTYSEVFKMKIVDEIEQGYLTQAEASRLYNTSDSNISRWIVEYGMNHKIGKKVIIMSDRELRQSDLLKSENKQLKRALEDSQFSNLILEKYIQFIAEKEGIDLKKNINSNFSKESQQILVSRLLKDED